MFATWISQRLFIVMELVFSTWICLLEFVLKVSIYCIMFEQFRGNKVNSFVWLFIYLFLRRCIFVYL